MTGKRAAIVLAAGKGKRMKSDLPKVLHRIDGRPMVSILLDTLVRMKFDRIVVVIGHKGEMVQQELADYPVEFVWQREQKGTGHAVMMAREVLGDFDGTTLVAAGDVPFLSKESIEGLFDAHVRNQASATCLTAIFDDPTGYGRVIRDQGGDMLEAIVEHKDAAEDILRIKEINTGILCFNNEQLFAALEKIDDNNAQGEYYLTDTVKIMHTSGLRVAVETAENPDEVLGINSVEQLTTVAGKFAGK